MTTDTETTDVENENEEEKQKMSLDVQVDKPSTCQRHITVTISKDDVNRYFDEAYTDLMPKASVPGFRSGRAPRKLVESKFRSEVADQVKGSLLMDSMTQITEDNDFSAISEPEFDFDAIELPDDGPLTFEFDLEVRPEFDMPKWKGLSLEKATREFDKKDIDDHLEELLGRRGKLVSTDEPASVGDYVVANLKVAHDDEVVSEAEALSLRVRKILSFPDGQIDDFDKLMAGAKGGDTKEAKVTISYDAPNVDLQGKEVAVDFEVLEVKKLELPKIDEELLEKLGGYETEGDLRDAIKQELERRLGFQQQQKIRGQITQKLTQGADWDLPPDLLKRQSGRELERAKLELRRNGYSEDEIQAYENELRQNSQASTKRALQEHFIFERIAEDEEVDADPQDYDMEIALIAAQSNEPPRRVRARIEKKGLMDALRNQIIERKVIEMITSSAEFTETKLEVEQNVTQGIDHFLCGKSDFAIPEAKHGAGAQDLQTPADRT